MEIWTENKWRKKLTIMCGGRRDVKKGTKNKINEKEQE
jgi:hypothetical protein